MYARICSPIYPLLLARVTVPPTSPPHYNIHQQTLLLLQITPGILHNTGGYGAWVLDLVTFCNIVFFYVALWSASQHIQEKPVCIHVKYNSHQLWRKICFIDCNTVTMNIMNTRWEPQGGGSWPPLEVSWACWESGCTGMVAKWVERYSQGCLRTSGAGAWLQ